MKSKRLWSNCEFARHTLVVTRLDRLARSTLHICQIAAELEQKQVSLQVLDQNINTGDATGRLLFNMLGAIGQFETEIRAERQMDGSKLKLHSEYIVTLERNNPPYNVECFFIRKHN